MHFYPFRLSFLATTLLIPAGWCISCPNVTLPWGTYANTDSDDQGQYCVYADVRFGAAPNGTTRFQKPSFPADAADPSVLVTETGNSCYQARPSPANVTCPSNSFAAAAAAGGPRLGGPLPGNPRGATQSEDCLFADIYVPVSAFSSQVPVVIWIYGGAYIFGAKDTGFTNGMPFYDPKGLMRIAQQTGQEFIFIAGNYRLGAFGWLAGPTMEQGAAPNAGLWDQRLLMEFVNTYIGSFGGKTSDISLWGESAGGGSILHHLTSAIAPPPFHRVMVQSPAYLWQWDSTASGYAAQIFDKLVDMAGCSGADDQIACLQEIDEDTFQSYNQAIVSQEFTCTGLDPFNPAVDNTLIKELPTSAFYQNDGFIKLDSLLVSHVYDEAKSFVPPYVTTQDAFTKFLSYFMPGDAYGPQRAAIETQYPSSLDPYTRAHNVIQDSSFTCNTRFVFDAYHSQNTPVYMMQFQWLEYSSIIVTIHAAVHASDLVPLFLNPDVTEANFTAFAIKNFGISEKQATQLWNVEQGLPPQYQPYFASFAGTGAPVGGYGVWSVPPSSDNQLTNVMQVGTEFGFSSPHLFPDWNNQYVDTQNSNDICSFWHNMSTWVQSTVGKDKTVLVTQDDYFRADL